ncbi:MAG: GHMP kinase [Chloroflexi bacterium]|nr:GHMP kinase [Chloroflexota bacterium]
MIISRTPLRISFAGGGTDLPAYYTQEPGAVLSTAIAKYIYVTVNKKFDDLIRVSYSITEIVEDVDSLKHGLVREALKLAGIGSGIEITTIADVPSRGTGLGSSSTLTVGLLNALAAFQGQAKSAKMLAEQACEIEINRLGEPIGKQDQYIAAYGGLQFIQFQPDGSVFVDPVICPQEVKQQLERNLLLFYTGRTREANTVLLKQRQKTPANRDILRKMRGLAFTLRDCLTNNRDLDRFGQYLHQGWEYKKQLASGISDALLDSYYERALAAGALGGKLLGAGGGGFFLFYCPEDRQDGLRHALADLKETRFRFEPQGSKIIYVGD